MRSYDLYKGPMALGPSRLLRISPNNEADDRAHYQGKANPAHRGLPLPEERSLTSRVLGYIILGPFSTTFAEIVKRVKAQKEWVER